MPLSRARFPLRTNFSRYRLKGGYVPSRQYMVVKALQDRRELLQSCQQTITTLTNGFLLKRFEHHDASARCHFQIVYQAAIFYFQCVAERAVLLLPYIGVAIEPIRISLDSFAQSLSQRRDRSCGFRSTY